MSNQSLRHASFRVISGTTGSYNEDSLAAFGVQGAVSSNYNSAFVDFLQIVTGSSQDTLEDLKNLFATQQGAGSWDELGTFSIGVSSGTRITMDGLDTRITMDGLDIRTLQGGA